MIGRKFTEFMTAESAALVDERLAHFLELGKVHDYEFDLVKKDGTVITVSFEGNIAYDENGKFKQTHCIFTEITEKRKIENDLKESEKRYRDLFNEDLTGDYVTDVEGNILLCNIALAKIFGYESVEEMMNESAKSFYRPGDNRNLFLNKIREEKKLINYEHELVRPDGKRLHIIENAIGEFDGNGNLVKIKGYMFDNTDRKIAEEALRESEERYRLILENSLDAVLLTKPDGIILSANRSACLMFDRTEEEICRIGRNSLVEKDDKRLAALINELEIKRRARGELNMVKKDGTKFPVEITSSVFIDRNGEQRSSMIIRDITERKKAERALKESEERFRKLFENHSAVKLLIDPVTGDIIDANEAAEKFYGWSRNELKRMRINQLNMLSTETIFDEMSRAKNTEKNRFEFQHKLKDGNIRHVEVLSSKIELGGRQYLYSIIHDITERKKTQEELKLSNLRYQTLFNKAGDGIITITADGRITSANESFAEMHGYSTAELENMNINDIEAPESRHDYEKRISRLMNGESLQFEIQHYHKSGHIIFLEVSAGVIRIGDENLIQAFHQGG